MLDLSPKEIARLKQLNAKIEAAKRAIAPAKKERRAIMAKERQNRFQAKRRAEKAQGENQ